MGMNYESARRDFQRDQAPRPAGYHVRRRFRRRRLAWLAGPAGTLPTVGQVADADYLIATYYDLKDRAGPAPGPDGVSYSDLGGREVADILRALSEAVLDGGYAPGPTRPVTIPKPRGGFRTLRLANLLDRVLAAALHTALEPFWETVFLPMSMGFRPGRDTWRLLAELEATMVREGRWVLAADDIRKAFDSVVIGDVLADHARHVQDESLLSLVEVVLRGGDGKRQRGIDQGSPYSPTALNVRLHHALDLEADQGHKPFRYADNLVFACRDVSEGHQALLQARQLLEQADLTLKGEDGPPRDLQRGETAQLLGFTLSQKDGALHLDLGQDAWARLEQALVKAHETDNPAATATSVVTSWVTSWGPAFESLRDDPLTRVLDTAADIGFREVISQTELTARWRDSWLRWTVLRQTIQRNNQG
jgi:hypothetical protein